MVVFGHDLTLYRHRKGRVIIERVLHGARDIPTLS
jgi:hypothetical protein